MNSAIETLLTDHDWMRKMLDCFEAQIDAFEQADRPDYDILSDTLAYCRDSLDQWHHACEDAMFEILETRDASKVSSLSELGEQHRALAATTARVAGVFDDVAERGAVQLREDLVSAGRELAAAYRHHIGWEEANFFPTVQEAFTPTDWEALSRRLDGVPPGLEKHALEKKYQRLFEAIAEQPYSQT